jgi:hypothetical protein
VVLEKGGDTMATKKDLIIAVLATFSLTVTLFAVLPTRSSPGISGYDPWLDYNDDGKISLEDITATLDAFGSEGTPLNKTALLLELKTKVLELQSKLGENFSGSLPTPAYDSVKTLPAATTGPGIDPPIYPSQTDFQHNLGTTEVFVYITTIEGNEELAFPEWNLYGDQRSWYLWENVIMVKNFYTHPLEVRIRIWRISQP